MNPSQSSEGAVLVGRRAELAVLDRRLAEAAAGRGGVVFLAGEPGIGKSRLAEEVDRRADRRGFQVVWGRCRETEGAPAFWPWTQILRAVLPDTDAGAPEDLRPLLDSRYPAARQADRFQLFDAVAGLLLGHSRVRPLVLILDDLHRADHASLLLMNFLAPSARDAALLVVATFRDTEVTAAHPLRAIVEERTGDAGVDLLELGGLSLEDTAQLAAGQEAECARLSVGELQRRTDGNPFFLSELLRLRPEAGDAVPVTVSAAIAARVRRLPGPTVHLLKLAAVLGREFSVPVVAALAGSAPDEIDRLLVPAIAGGLVQPAGNDGSGYRFTHVLVRDALYAAIPPSRRAGLHDLVLAASAAPGGESVAGPSERASHAIRTLRSPGERRRALELAGIAAAAARDRLAHEEAAAWFGRALELGAETPEERFELLMELGGCAGRASQVAAARSAYERAWSVACEEGWGHRLAEVALGLGEAIDAAGTVDAGLVRMLEQSLDRADPADRVARIRLTARLAVEIYWSSRLAEARHLASDAVAAARRLGDSAALARALGAQQYVLRGPGHLAEHLRLGQELVGLARARSDERLELQGRRLLLADRWQLDPAEAETDLRALGVLAEHTKRPLARWYVMINECIRASLYESPERGLALVEQTEAFGLRIGAHPAAMYGVSQRFFVLWAAGRAPEAEADVRRMIHAYPRVVTLRCALAVLLAEAERGDEAEALLAELVAGECRAVPPDALWLSSLALLAIAAARLDRQDEAATLYHLLQPHAGTIAFQGLVVWWGSVDHYLALTAGTLGRWDEAERLFRSALRRHELWAAAPWIRASLAGLAAARQRRASGERPRGAEPFRPVPAQLTAREREVLELIAAGAANKQIARRLAISVHTVERHVTSLYIKIGIHNRAEATAFVLQRQEGLAAPPSTT